ncbi:FG-GAP repeat domain-containing protein [Aquiflexum gelatinilyticum]|uniref:VCBS repeat-containing protein n=1 Tax=Aquiflexum gelatinilyticum TaxID=2961943 RepID=A0A9X2PBS1_9BACT|nr:VCBS repeat-containing protein [Aquiflexum gelatinilyticum]MCR9016694.1 VCBS repeat-containing protein [Aquiflexum gelatinilyticum]
MKIFNNSIHTVYKTFKMCLLNKNYRISIILGSMVLTIIQSGFSQNQTIKGDKISFQRQVLTSEFLAEGVGVGDVNHDGRMDVMAGAYWFEAPDWKKHEITQPQKFEYDKGYSNAFICHGMDVNKDGWVDFVRIGFPGKEVFWFENPKNERGHWKRHVIHPTLGNESAGFYDIDGDGELEILGGNSATGQMVWLKPLNYNGRIEWKEYTISQNEKRGSEPYSHGLGFGDINGDGRKDVIIRDGWWEAPQDPRTPNWKFHPANLGEPAAQMYAYDFNGDGFNDVLSSSAHELGIWWHKKGKDSSGNPTWKTNLIDDTYTQTHGVAFVDINSNGLPDFVTGKRYFAHMGSDPGEFDTPFLYWYEFVPGAKPTWIPHKIDEDSGVGVHVLSEDINKDGLPDIIISNKKGVFVFVQKRD